MGEHASFEPNWRSVVIYDDTYHPAFTPYEDRRAYIRMAEQVRNWCRAAESLSRRLESLAPTVVGETVKWMPAWFGETAELIEEHLTDLARHGTLTDPNDETWRYAS